MTLCIYAVYYWTDAATSSSHETYRTTLVAHCRVLTIEDTSTQSGRRSAQMGAFLQAAPVSRDSASTKTAADMTTGATDERERARRACGRDGGVAG